MTQTRDPWLLTPGPLTTSATVKEAMLHDWGSRDANFIRINKEVREGLLEIAGATGSRSRRRAPMAFLTAGGSAPSPGPTSIGRRM